MPKFYVVAGEKFRTKDDVLAHASAILNAEPIGSLVTGVEADFLSGLLALRPEKLEEIGERTVVGFQRDWQPEPFSETICFWAMLNDGSRVDFSVYTAVRLLKERDL